MEKPILTVDNLEISFGQGKAKQRAVRGVSLELYKGQILAILGESGSGKSATALSFCKLLPPPPHCYITGKITYKQQDILALNGKGLQAIRGKEIAYIFQEPSTSLNPSLSIEYQIKEAICTHFPKTYTIDKAIQLLKDVDIQDPKHVLKAYPHELSGGMQQRVMIAIALACKPSILVADEPTTALDVNTQKNILALLKKIQKEHNMSIVLITHNFSIVSNFADDIAFMYKGLIVEQGKTKSILENPKHAYTRALMECIPHLNKTQKRLTTIDFEAL